MVKPWNRAISATPRRSRSCCAARRRRSTARGRGWSRALRRDPTATVDLALGPRARSRRCGPAPRKRPDPRRLPRAAGEAMRDTVPGAGATRSRRASARRWRRPSPASPASRGRCRRNRSSATERAELLAAPLAAPRPAARLPLGRRGGDPARSSAPSPSSPAAASSSCSARSMTIDALSLVVCTMMGLALGVDYSLLIVSRFREELERGRGALGRGRAAPAPPPGARPSSPARPCSSARRSPPSCSPARCCSRWRRRSASSPRSASLIAVAGLPPPARPARRARSTPGAIGRAAARAGRRSRGRRPRPPRRPAPPGAWPRSLIAVPLVAARRCPPSPSTPARPGSTSCRPPTRPARTPKRSTARVGPGWEAPFVLVAADRARPDHDAAQRLALLQPLAAADRRPSRACGR